MFSRFFHLFIAHSKHHKQDDVYLQLLLHMVALVDKRLTILLFFS